MEIEITVDDPKLHTAMSVALHQDILVDTELMEYFCTENETATTPSESKRTDGVM